MNPTDDQATDDQPTDVQTTDVQENKSEQAFQPSPAWIVVGLLAIALGVGCGLVMSSATFLR